MDWEKATREELIELYICKMLTASEIAALYCVKPHCVNAKLSRRGIKRTLEQDLIIRRRFAKTKLSSPAWHAAFARGLATRKKRAEEEEHIPYAILMEEVVCPDCGFKRTIEKRGRSVGGETICVQCRGKRTATNPTWIEKNREILRIRNSNPPNPNWNVGANNFNWKGGITPATVKERTSPAYRAWMRAVFQRDHSTCQVCLKKASGKLHAHHIKAFSNHPELRLDLDNGLTSCKWCHAEILHKGSWQNEPLAIEDILEIQAMVRDGTLSMDWEEAA